MVAVIAAAKKRGKLALVHIGSHAGAREAIEAGADGLVHLFTDRAPDPGFAALVREHGAFIVPTMAVLESVGGTAGGAIYTEDSTIAPWLDETTRRSLRSSFPANAVRPQKLEYASATIRGLKEAGVPLLAGTDAPNPGTAHGVSMHRELELLVAAGLTPTEALAAGTSTPARLFRLDDRGEIRVGKRADLLLVAGDPTTDISATRKIAGIWKNGTRVDRSRWRDSLETIRATALAQRQRPAPAGSESGWVSQFEEPAPQARFGAGWMVTTDAMADGRSTATISIESNGANGSQGALRIDARIDSSLAYAWAGAMFSPGPTMMAPANLSRFKEITFMAKGDGSRHRIMLFASSRGYQPITRQFTAGTEWTRHTFQIAQFDGIDGSDLLALMFVAGPAPGGHSFLIDDIQFR